MPRRRSRKKKPIEKVKRYISGLLRTASKQKQRVLVSARSAMERLYGR